MKRILGLETERNLLTFQSKVTRKVVLLLKDLDSPLTGSPTRPEHYTVSDMNDLNGVGEVYK